jgi:DTW domain-containing protein YfiP
MKFTLLTHFKEFEKRSNTGRVVLDVLGSDAPNGCTGIG